MQDDFTSWPHLLYVSGVGVDYAAVQKLVDQFDHFSLGPQCWILKGLPPERHRFAEALQKTLPALPEKSEFLLCPLSKYQFLESKQGGFGLYAWLSKQGS